MSVLLALFFVLSPLLIAAVYTSLELFRDLHNVTLSRRQTVAFLVAATLKEKLDRVIDVGVSLSTRVQFQKLVEAGEWDEAVQSLKRVPQDFTYIDRASLFDPQGILHAATQPTPEILSVIGQDFSYRDYYQGVSKNWEPYVAEVIKPAVPLGYNLVPIAIPIKSESQKILGIMLLSIQLDTVAAWSKNIDVGPAGFVYIVDHTGHLVAHPTLLPAEDVVDFSSVPSVQKVLLGEKGVEIIFNPIENEERLTAYEPVPQYGWGVVVVQPTRTAFVQRNKAVGRMVTIWALVIFAVGFFTYRLLRDRTIIKAQRDRETLFLESIGDGVVAIDRHWNITLWNKAASVLTGYGKNEVFGKPFRDVVKFIRERDRNENIVFIENAMVTGKPQQLEDHTFLITKEGKEIPVGDSAAPIFGRGGEVIGAIIVFRDASKEREVQMLRSDFAYASHQLRTPVNQALWALELVFREKDPEAVKQAAHTAYFSIHGVQKLMNQLIEVSEIDQNTVIPKKEMVRLTELIDEVLAGVNSEAKARNIAIVVPPISLTASIHTDRKLVKRILTEVLENALYYSTEKGEVHLEISSKENGLLIEITDTGLGISKEQQPVVFTKFFRGSNFDTTKIIGAGLGLYISREYVKLLGGKIWFTSEEKKGTTFSIFLPVA